MAEVKEIVSAILEGADIRATLEAGGPTVTKKVVRNGKVVKKKFRKYKKKRILSAAQKKAIKKAQSKSKSAAARMKRTKSLNKAKTLEAVDMDTDIVISCPDCGSNDFEVGIDDETGATIFICPDCGAEFSLVNNEVLSAFIPDDDDDDEDLEISIGDDDGDDDEIYDGEEDSDGDLDEGCEPEDPDDETMYFDD